MSSKGFNAYTTYNRVKIVRGGREYFSCIEEIAARAQYSLHLQTYIFDEDETGTQVTNALMAAARRGVLVYMLLDGYASQKLSARFIAALKDAGVHFHFFEPFMKGDTFYVGRRLHHKVIVADGAICMVAGINVSNRYNDIGNITAWLDWAVYAEGEIAQKAEEACLMVWNRSPTRGKCLAEPNKLSIPLPKEECMVRLRRNDWVYGKTEITKTYREMFQNARSHVTLMTSYFWPPHKLLKRMAKASRKGVKVRLILTATADVPLAKYAERYLYNWLFRNKIEVYEYQSSVLHGKLAVCDNKWLTAGSYNVNNISARASVEMNLDIRNAEIATQVQEKLNTIIANDCVAISPREFMRSTNMMKQFYYYLSYRIVHWIFYLFTFYFIQKRESA